jgi:hypothetical protein
MKKIWMLAVLLVLAVMFGLSDSASAGTRMMKIRTLDDTHEVWAPAIKANGKYFLARYVFVGEKARIPLSSFVRMSFRSERVGNTAHSTGRRIVRNASGLWVVFVVTGTFDNDLGNWVGEKVSGSSWVNLDFVRMSGLPHARIENQIRYGTYKPPEINFVSPGQIQINWNVNGITGLVGGPVDSELVNFVRWNSDQFGWGNNSRTCVPTLGLLSHFECSIPSVYNADCGAFSVLLKGPTPSVVWMNNSAWNFSSNSYQELDLLGNPNGRICYILP